MRGILKETIFYPKILDRFLRPLKTPKENISFLFFHYSHSFYASLALLICVYFNCKIRYLCLLPRACFHLSSLPFVAKWPCLRLIEEIKTDLSYLIGSYLVTCFLQTILVIMVVTVLLV